MHARLATTAADEGPNGSDRSLQDSAVGDINSASGIPGEVPGTAIDWSRSFHGLSAEPFSKETSEILMADLPKDDVEIKPDGILYLPEIRYRRILNRAFGPGGWGLAPRGETLVGERIVSREYALICHGRLVSVARGEQEFFNPEGIATATEGCKSNALMRCCKDLGIASELWDPGFIRKFKKEHCVEQFVEHVVSKKKRKLWRRKDGSWEYPYKLSTFTSS
ncbi:mitochondrial genome maintenance protein MGM101 [Protomyces lactucae-debilis]|uniref:Mitochondrial genome maintenance protein MGM101 n=1 Tax=Protomyces lactucae-debilis TaxID=2754530 RepID=A0A1Y2F964_PROLT|nr:mitochondrial genome maintenance protein MGM101 [Protomyces lactucae-debilis]ORY79974.1 mitochondrial genome maintenance protein MGM101 [Protomyces lactucae-debilis]